MKFILLVVLLSGCASLPTGVTMSDEEREACAAEGCSVWTPAELERLVGMAMKRGYLAGERRRNSI